MRRELSAAAIVAALAGTAIGQSTVPFPAQFNLSTLLPANGGDGADGFVLNGIDAYDFSGVCVSSAGDMNGDGIDDLIIGAYLADLNANLNAGESYVVFGGGALGAGGALGLSNLNGANGFVLQGIDINDRSGHSVSAAGDVNGDGIDDVIIGAHLADQFGLSATGESYVVFGRDTAVNRDFPAAFSLSTLSGANGFALKGIELEQFSGWSVSSAGDLNGDKIGDLIIGAFAADPNGKSAAGKSFVMFGRVGIGAGGSLFLTGLNGSNGFVINGIDVNDRSGWCVSSAGDVNGDGFDDLIVGAYGADPNDQSQAGESYVVFGRAGLGAGGTLNLSSLNGANGFVINGIDAGDRSGWSVASAGDVNGDGVDDLIIGGYLADPNGNLNAGESYVVFGGAGLGAGGSLDLSSLNGVKGFVLNGIDSNDRCGHSVSSAGDVNGDGIDDLIIGAFYADPNGNSNAGESYVVFGAVGIGASGSLDLSSLNGANGFVLNGIAAGDHSGHSVSSAGDVNADGVDDLIIGAKSADPNGRRSAGESYVVFGRRVAPPGPCPGDADGDNLVDFNDINSVIANWLASYAPGTGPGDANHDGVVDFNDINSVLANWLRKCP